MTTHDEIRREKDIRLLAEFFYDALSEDAFGVADWWDQGDELSNTFDDFCDRVRKLKVGTP